jgi:hypothetical protein
MKRFEPAVTVEGSSLMANIVAMPPEFRDLFLDFQDVTNPAGRIPVSKHESPSAADHQRASTLVFLQC